MDDLPLLYPSMLPFFAVTAVVGALVGRHVWAASRLDPRHGTVVGALVGAAGPLATMLPLRSCTFAPEQPVLDRVLGVVVFGLGAAVALGALAWGTRTVAQQRGWVPGAPQETTGHIRARGWVPLALLAPTLAVLVFFLYWPTLETLRLSTRAVRLGAPVEPMVCLANYTRLMEPTLEWWLVLPALALLVVWVAVVLVRRQGPAQRDLVDSLVRLRGLLVLAVVVAGATALFGDAYRQVFVTTLILTSGTVVLGLVVGLAIAVLASQPVRGRGIYQALLIWPFAISPPIAGVLFFVMFDPLSGVVGSLVGTYTPFELPSYRTDPTLARGLVILASVWKTLGFTILFYIAGLQTVNREMLEAGMIDGAGAWQRFRHLVVPALSPITFFLVVTNVTYAFFEVFGTITYLTSGGPSGATTDAMTSLVQAGRVQGNFGDGAAQSMILFAMVLAVTAWQFRVTGRRVSYGS